MCILRPLTDGVYYPLLSKGELAENREMLWKVLAFPNRASLFTARLSWIFSDGDSCESLEMDLRFIYQALLKVPLDILPGLYAGTDQAHHRRHLQLVRAQ